MHHIHSKIRTKDGRVRVASANVLRQLRTEKKMTQRQVALDLGVRRSSYQRYERGEGELSTTLILMLESIFQVPDGTITKMVKEQFGNIEDLFE